MTHKWVSPLIRFVLILRVQTLFVEQILLENLIFLFEKMQKILSFHCFLRNSYFLLIFQKMFSFSIFGLGHPAYDVFLTIYLIFRLSTGNNVIKNKFIDNLSDAFKSQNILIKILLIGISTIKAILKLLEPRKLLERRSTKILPPTMLHSQIKKQKTLERKISLV
jgi:hypothetical protein